MRKTRNFHRKEKNKVLLLFVDHKMNVERVKSRINIKTLQKKKKTISGIMIEMLGIEKESFSSFRKQFY